jgi:type II secretory pathway predicted ATPase ExeA
MDDGGGCYLFLMPKEGPTAMYDTQFGLTSRPFRPTPDTAFYYPATTHEYALAALRRGLTDDEGVLLLTSDPGCGKTLLAWRLLEELDESYRTVLLTNGYFTNRGDLHQAILFDLGLPYQSVTEQTARLMVMEASLEHFRTGGRTLIVVDEAHHLSPILLEELRLLSNLEGKGGKAVQVLLVALPDITKTLERQALAALRQRLMTRTHLEPLGLDESVDYLRHQIRVAGGNPDVLFGEDVLDILTQSANGIPRLLNQSAHLAFTLAKENGLDHVDAEAAIESITQLGLDPIANGEPLAEGEDEPVRLVPVALAVETPPPSTTPTVAVTRPEMDEPTRLTIPFPPVILPIENGPPTYVYEGKEGDLGSAPRMEPTDQVG